MKHRPSRIPSLAELEAEVLEEGREWMRRRLQQKLQALAEEHGEVFPPQQSTTAPSAPTPDAAADGRRRD
jgi:hypothetical protein